MFLRFNNLDYLLKTAEKHDIYKYKKPYDPDEYDDQVRKQLRYLDKRIVEKEKLQPFHFKEKHMFESGEDDKILSHSERSQLLHSTIDESNRSYLLISFSHDEQVHAGYQTSHQRVI